ncbi:MAG: hypothetical protein AABY22_00645 [Nanoarchaeota archaeon]
MKKSKLVTLTIKLPIDLYKKIKKLTEKEGISLNDWMVRALKWWIKNHSK